MKYHSNCLCCLLKIPPFRSFSDVSVPAVLVDKKLSFYISKSFCIKTIQLITWYMKPVRQRGFPLSSRRCFFFTFYRRNCFAEHVWIFLWYPPSYLHIYIILQLRVASAALDSVFWAGTTLNQLSGPWVNTAAPSVSMTSSCLPAVSRSFTARHVASELSQQGSVCSAAGQGVALSAVPFLWCWITLGPTHSLF